MEISNNGHEALEQEEKQIRKADELELSLLSLGFKEINRKEIFKDWKQIIEHFDTSRTIKWRFFAK